MIKTAAIPMDKEIQSFQFIFTGQQYKIISKTVSKSTAFSLRTVSDEIAKGQLWAAKT